MFNKIVIMGRLTFEPTVKATTSGVTMTNFSIANNRSFKKGDGSFGEEVCYLDVTAFGKTGEFAQKLTKGNKVLVEGRLKQEEWQTQNGEKRRSYKVIADSIETIERNENNGYGGGGNEVYQNNNHAQAGYQQQPQPAYATPRVDDADVPRYQGPIQQMPSFDTDSTPF